MPRAPTKIRTVRLTDEEMAEVKRRGGLGVVVRAALSAEFEDPLPIAEAKEMVENLEARKVLTGTGDPSEDHKHRWKPDPGAPWMEVCMDCNERRSK